jgi:hypothetical protein
MEIGAYIITIVLILTGCLGLIALPLTFIAGALGVGQLFHVLAPFFAYYFIDWVWGAVGAGVLPICLLIFAAAWSPVYAGVLRGRLNHHGLSALYGQGWAAIFYGGLKYFTEDQLRWF